MDLEIIKLASDTVNFRDIKKYTHYSKSKNPLCGDEIHIKLTLDKKKIVDFGYQGKSCVYCQATSSLLSKKLINSKIENIDELCDYAKTFFEEKHDNILRKWNFLRKILNQKNLSRKECILLPFNALKKIVIKL